MNIAILGLGTVGFGVYDIIKKTEYLKDIKIKYILDKCLEKQKDVEEKIVDSFDVIVNDKDIEVVIECMGAGNFSYKCIVEALKHKKSVITANKEVVSSHIKELTKLKEENKVSLYYEAAVGGGVPIIKPLHTLVLTNEVSEIRGILNGTTNYILTKMANEKMSFRDALKLAQKNGFAESDPTADLEGLDMVRKISILSSIAYKCEVNPDNVYHYGISNLGEVDIEFALKEGYRIKLLASSKCEGKNIEIKVEPVFASEKGIIANVINEENIIAVSSSINDKLYFIGKGAGRYPTANAMVNDLIMIKDNDKNYSFKEKEKKQIKDLKNKCKYYIRVKDIKYIDEDIIDRRENNQIITKEILFSNIEKIKNNIYFYARIGE